MVGAVRNIAQPLFLSLLFFREGLLTAASGGIVVELFVTGLACLFRYRRFRFTGFLLAGMLRSGIALGLLLCLTLRVVRRLSAVALVGIAIALRLAGVTVVGRLVAVLRLAILLLIAGRALLVVGAFL